MAARLSGSIYDGFSPRGQRALAELRAKFQAAGFYAEKERRTERTLRIYPERRWRYPLLNPGFVRTQDGPSVSCPIYSDGDGLITRLLDAMPVIPSCSYVPARPRRIGRYLLHGTVAWSLSLSDHLIDFGPMRASLAKLQLELSRAWWA